MTTEIYFIAGLEAHGKEKVIEDLTRVLFDQGKTVAVRYKAARIDLIDLYGTIPVWGLLERVDTVIHNTINTVDVLIMPGWHVDSVLSGVYDKYPEANFVFVKADEADALVTAHMLEVISQQKVDEILADEQQCIDAFLAEKNITLDYVRTNPGFDANLNVVPDSEGKYEVAILPARS